MARFGCESGRYEAMPSTQSTRFNGPMKSRDRINCRKGKTNKLVNVDALIAGNWESRPHFGLVFPTSCMRMGV
jgi:hypothetical protein